MTLTVSISDFRNNVSEYLDKVSRGDHVVIHNNKKGADVAQITPIHSFDAKAFQQALNRTTGIFTAKNHPEWATKQKISAWLRKTRLANERSFKNVPS